MFSIHDFTQIKKKISILYIKSNEKKNKNLLKLKKKKQPKTSFNFNNVYRVAFFRLKFSYHAREFIHDIMCFLFVDFYVLILFISNVQCGYLYLLFEHFLLQKMKGVFFFSLIFKNNTTFSREKKTQSIFLKLRADFFKQSYLIYDS